MIPSKVHWTIQDRVPTRTHGMASELAEADRVRERLSPKQSDCDVPLAYSVVEPDATEPAGGHLLVSTHVPTNIAESR